MRIALSQIVADVDPKANLDIIRGQALHAAERDARIVVFPEGAMARFGVRLQPIAEPLDGPWAREVRRIAADAGIVVVVGMFTPAPDGRVTNTLLVTGPGVDTSYDKIHLYDAFGFTESRTVAPGSEVVTVDVDGVRIGLATCYDVRFPELFRAHADAGALVCLLAASWGAGPGKRAQWDLLIRARALDATLWLAAVGQADPISVGVEVSATAPTGIGYSAVVGPDGSIREQLGAEPGMIIADLDIDEVAAMRQKVPVLENRRFGWPEPPA
ncbi:carbon-nitrogen hydrolase family protein [Frankia sp. Cppng1_Ct_nod]|uniref:carbon-nitrogen hydrolase family protein n=1 Tax=Frankia sp. Cppng1_Ct_nod TaxID=2897162 RepID=UPI00104186B6|nr:carbon-nitrogen hydrolase family protein [Frankia sp. Cppng1_Ct_nod]